MALDSTETARNSMNSEFEGKHPLTHKGTQHGWRTLLPWALALAAVWAFELGGAHNIHPYYFTVIMYAGVYITLAVSLNLLNGFTGQFSMGHAGFMAIGGYSSAFLSTWVQTSYPDLALVYYVGDEQFVTLAGNVLLITGMILGGLAAAIAGYVVGLPSLRLRGDYLAIVTLGFGEIIRVLILNIDALGGARGMANIPLISTFGWVYTMVVVTVFAVWRTINSAHGRSFLSVREDEIAAEAMGVNTTRAKVRAFVMGAFFAGIAGALFAHFLRYLNPSTFDYNRSFEIIIMVVLGGMGSITGSVVGAAFIAVSREALRGLQDIDWLRTYTQGVDLRMVIYSLMLIVLMLTRPNGLFGTREITDFLPEKWRRFLLGKNEESGVSK
jgi:branched-chain amino acid transport system permease protein